MPRPKARHNQKKSDGEVVTFADSQIHKLPN